MKKCLGCPVKLVTKGPARCRACQIEYEAGVAIWAAQGIREFNQYLNGWAGFRIYEETEI